jgi:poly [ADP-ribose] polymerase 7/11/12/13
MKLEMKQRLGAKFGERHFLFHGTPDLKTARSICNQSFDCRLFGRNGTNFGNGTYFATKAKYSHHYTRDHGQGRFMFVASVLVGNYAKGRKGMRRPPPLREHHGILHDSVVNILESPTIFVIFQNDQAYATHLIEYSHGIEQNSNTTIEGEETAAGVEALPWPGAMQMFETLVGKLRDLMHFDMIPKYNETRQVVRYEDSVQGASEITDDDDDDDDDDDTEEEDSY